jgi:hypothetical protein
MRRSELLALTGLFCTACSYPMAIELSGYAGHVVLSFHDCGTFFNSPVECEDVAIREYEPTTDTYGDWVCRASFSPTRQWTYNDKLPDCRPLVAGQTYEVVVSGTQGRDGSRTFKLAPSGPLALDQGCP